MQDELDEALRKMPSAAYPARLNDQIIHHLRRARQRQRLLLRAGWAGAVSGALAGAWLLAGRLYQGSAVLPAFSSGGIIRWAGTLGASPCRTTIDSTISILDLGQMLMVELGWVSVAGLTLLLLSAFWMLGKVLFENDIDEVMWA